jgi:hypothetical protein
MAIRYKDTEEAAAFITEKGLPTAASTLRKFRCVGGGPRYVVYGRKPRYIDEWLEEWLLQKLSPPRRSSSAAVLHSAR